MTRTLLILLSIGAVCACSNTAVRPQPVSISSPNLDSGIRSGASGGPGSDAVVGKPTGGGVVSRTTVP